MKKVKLSKEEKQKQKLQKVYNRVDSELQLAGKDTAEKMHILVDAACDVQAEICKVSDSIKIDDLETVQELTQIDKSTWLDFVRIASLKNVGKLQEKAISKFEQDFEQRLFITNLRKSFLESYMSGEDLKITDDENYAYEKFEDYKSDEFLSQLEKSAQQRVYINTVLRQKYKELAIVANYITDGELKPKDFKNLVDWEYYKDGGYPTPTSPSKIWKIFKDFDYAFRLMKKYGYDSSELSKEFGLEITLHTPQPVDHPWVIEKDDE